MDHRSTRKYHAQASRSSADLNPHPYRLFFINAYDAVDVRQIVGEAIYREWLDLDHLLVRFPESRSVRLRVKIDAPTWELKQNIKRCIWRLFPETLRTSVGIINTICCTFHSSKTQRPFQCLKGLSGIHVSSAPRDVL